MSGKKKLQPGSPVFQHASWAQAEEEALRKLLTEPSRPVRKKSVEQHKKGNFKKIPGNQQSCPATPPPGSKKNIKTQNRNPLKKKVYTLRPKRRNQKPGQRRLARAVGNSRWLDGRSQHLGNKNSTREKAAASTGQRTIQVAPEKFKG